jgi:hypothetical protein
MSEAQPELRTSRGRGLGRPELPGGFRMRSCLGAIAGMRKRGTRLAGSLASGRGQAEER